MDENRGLEKNWNRSWGATFDAVADAYDTARPGYPSQLYDNLKTMCGLDVATRVLEVGCGTGQATCDIASISGSITALEPGAALAHRARTRLESFQNVEVKESTFEDFDGEPEAFDLITSATAFHWVDSDVGFVKAAELLRPGGWLALWWTVYEDPEEEDSFGDEIMKFMDARGQPGYSGVGYGLRTDERVSDFRRSGAFGTVQTRRYPWIGKHSAGEIRTLFSTYSNVQAMGESRRNSILDGIEEIATTKFGGRVTRPYVTALYAAQKAGE